MNLLLSDAIYMYTLLSNFWHFCFMTLRYMLDSHPLIHSCIDFGSLVAIGPYKNNTNRTKKTIPTNKLG